MIGQQNDCYVKRLIEFKLELKHIKRHPQNGQTQERHIYSFVVIRVSFSYFNESLHYFLVLENNFYKIWLSYDDAQAKRTASS